MTLLFAAAMFVNALLLFLVQPMFAKLLLPRFGGSPAVWTTCMLFFQTALLAGYAYSHSVVKLRHSWQQAAVHLLVIALPVLTLPIAVSAVQPASGAPIAEAIKKEVAAEVAELYEKHGFRPCLTVVRVGEDRQPIDALRPAGRWLGDAVPDRAQVLVLLHRLQPRVVRVLEVLQHPQPAACVEAHADRLADHRLGRDRPDGEPVGQPHPPHRLDRREPLGKCGSGGE